MVSFRPHKMRVVERGNGAYDDNGTWHENEEIGHSDYIPCRYEPNGAARTVTLPDGTAYRYSYMVYLDVNPAFSVKYGDTIELTSQDGVVIAKEAKVLGFHRGQLDMKIWV